MSCVAHVRPAGRIALQETATSHAQTAPELADLARLSIREVCALVGESETAVREKIRTGRFPQPDYRDGPRCVRWSAGLVRRWLEATSTAQHQGVTR